MDSIEDAQELTEKQDYPAAGHAPPVTYSKSLRLTARARQISNRERTPKTTPTPISSSTKTNPKPIIDVKMPTAPQKEVVAHVCLCREETVRQHRNRRSETEQSVKEEGLLKIVKTDQLEDAGTAQKQKTTQEDAIVVVTFLTPTRFSEDSAAGGPVLPTNRQRLRRPVPSAPKTDQDCHAPTFARLRLRILAMMRQLSIEGVGVQVRKDKQFLQLLTIDPQPISLFLLQFVDAF